jgi:hypothetical protein
MSYTTKPWDDTKTDVDRINAIVKYLLSDDLSYERDPGSGIRMIWNGATEQNHKDATAESTESEPEPEPTEPEPTEPEPTPAPSCRLSSTLSLAKVTITGYGSP